jgi:hypothetical protein
MAISAAGIRPVANMGRMSIVELQRGNPHGRIIATDPEGNTLVVNSNRAVGEV